MRVDTRGRVKPAPTDQSDMVTTGDHPSGIPDAPPISVPIVTHSTRNPSEGECGTYT